MAGIGSKVCLASSPHVAAPAVWGLVRPRVIVPPGLMDRLAPDQAAWVLLHELAHIRRGDLWMAMVQRLVQIAYFFHPAVWLAARVIDQQREYACDDAALAAWAMPRPACGAGFLSVVEWANTRPRPAAQALAMLNHKTFLEKRLMRILDARRTPPKRLSRGAVALLMALAVVLLPNLRAAEFSQAATPPPSAASRSSRPGVDAKAEAKTMPVTVRGRAVDQAGKPIKGARIYLVASVWGKRVLVGEATTNGTGQYTIAEAKVPVIELKGFVHASTPFGAFQVCGMAPGFGLAWDHEASMYAVARPDPEDIQGRDRLGDPVEMDLTFRPAAELKGRVVDETGKPVEHVKVRVQDADLLDEKGLETHVLLSGCWGEGILPGAPGGAETDRDGRFRLVGLPSETCFWIHLTRPGPGNATLALYAAATHWHDKVHEERVVNGTIGGRARHAVATGDLNVTFPTTRRIAVRVVYGDTGKPAPGVNLSALGPDRATGITSWDTSDAEGNATLALPPGKYRGLVGDPPITTNYIRTYQPLTVAEAPAEQPYRFRLQPGCELLLETVEAATGKGIPNVFFWYRLADHPESWQYLNASTFIGPRSHTDADGKLRAVLPASPGKMYRIRVIGIEGKDVPEFPSFRARPPEGRIGGIYEPVRRENGPIELAAGTTVKIKFELRKRGPAPGAKSIPKVIERNR